MAITSATRERTGVPTGRARTGTAAWLIITGILLSAFNLRTAVISVGPLLDEIQRGLGMSATLAGVLTTLPVIAFAVFGGVTPALARRHGERTVLIASLLLMSLGLLVRATVTSVPVFLLASALALAGGAVGNVALPSVVKHYFPHRVGPMTTAYSTALAVGSMVSAATTVPLERLLGGSWQAALGIWMVPALLAVVPWLALRAPRPGTAPDRTTTPTDPPRLRGLARNRLSWALLLAFGSQSLIAYVFFGWLPEMLRDKDFGSAEAGMMMGVFTGVAIPVSIVVPLLAARAAHQRWILVALSAGLAAGIPLLWAGTAALPVWSALVLISIGMGTFPLMLTLFVLRARTSTGTAGLSAFAQSGGYLIAGAGPLLVGVFYQATDSWAPAFVLLLVAMVVHLVTAWPASAHRFVEDELTALPEPARH